MKILYNFSIKLYFLGIYLASFFNEKAKLWVNGRKGIFKKIESEIQLNDKHIWLHAASLGEFEQGLPVLEKIKGIYPDYKIVVTFFSPSGYEIKKEYPIVDHKFYLPLDTASNANRFIELINPKLVLFVKYEYWYNYFTVIKQREIPLFMISSIFHDNQVFFSFYGEFFRKILKSVSHFFVQEENSLNLIQSLGYKNSSVSGDSRYDRVASNKVNAKKYAIVERFKNGSSILIGGSTWKEEEEIMMNYYAEHSPNLKLIIAPHLINDYNIKSILKKLQDFNMTAVRYSEADEITVLNFKVLIIDNIGMLSSLYQYADFAFVGGGFGKAIHNILEAAVFGLPVFFGPNHRNFPEGAGLIDKGGGFCVSNYQDFKKQFHELCKDEDKLKYAGGQSCNMVQKNQGATKHIIEHIAQSVDL